MSWELLVSTDEQVALIDARKRKSGHVRVGIIVCANTAKPVATFKVPGGTLQLLIPDDCRNPGDITKALNLDLQVIAANE